ncbi:MAG TPA: hypothetical protein VEA99_08260 [Gemmatimonadaceae bacterium]|nr:hypothetical protein [Gemmatimonadaceae bacterium]
MLPSTHATVRPAAGTTEPAVPSHRWWERLSTVLLVLTALTTLAASAVRLAVQPVISAEAAARASADSSIRRDVDALQRGSAFNTWALCGLLVRQSPDLARGCEHVRPVAPPTYSP